jgi:diguanylate cyclase (GGDEF)-like protein
VRLPEPKPLYRYLLAVAALGASVLVALSIVHLDELLDPSGLCLVLAMFVVLGEMLPIQLPRRDTEITTSTTFAFAIVLSFGTTAAVVAQAIGSLITDVVRRRSPWRSAFNVGQYTLSFAAAGMVLSALSDVPAPTQPHFAPADVPAILLAGAVFFFTNNALAGVASALADQDSLLRHLWDDFRFQASAAAVLLGLSPVVIVSADFSPLLILMLVLPVAAVYLGGWQAALNDHQALHDPLTALPNRTFFAVRAEQAMRSLGENSRFGVIVVDLDRFKQVNDTLGHAYGDLLLKAVADRLRGALPGRYTVARLGGDEFAILLPRVDSVADAVQAAEQMAAALREPFPLNELTVDVGGSIGIACYPEHGQNVENLIQHADVAMYRAKQSNAGLGIYTPEAGRSHAHPLDFAADLRHAVEDDEIVLDYQPQLELGTGALKGVEVLIRWQHPTHGLILPNDFIPFAETTGLIRPLTRHVLELALEQFDRWRDRGLELDLAVNLSSSDLLDSQLPTAVFAALDRWGVDPGRLTLEITESNMVSESGGVGEVLKRLREVGVRLALDDFGTGYSSLTYLKHMPVSEVKVDRSFVTGMTEDPTNQTLVSSIVALGQQLGLRVVGEGVEDEASLSALRTLGCDAAQGFQISKPLSADELFRWAAQPRLLVGTHGVVTAHPARWRATGKSDAQERSRAVALG